MAFPEPPCVKAARAEAKAQFKKEQIRKKLF
jgi:hypothetical protein